MACTITPLKYENTLKANHPLRRDVASLSSGKPYDTPLEWHVKMTEACEKHGVCPGPLDGGVYVMPPDTQYEPITIPLYQGGKQIGAIYLGAYRYPSGRYEIVCYVC